MLKTVEWVKVELAAIDLSMSSHYQPGSPVNPGEVVIGEIKNDDTKKLVILLEQLTAQLPQESMVGSNLPIESIVDVSRLAGRIEFLDSLLQISIMEDFSTEEYLLAREFDAWVVKEDWQVVGGIIVPDQYQVLESIGLVGSPIPKRNQFGDTIH